jgi:hypothetical protein
MHDERWSALEKIVAGAARRTDRPRPAADAGGFQPDTAELVTNLETSAKRHEWAVRVRRRCHSDDLGACATDRFVEIRVGSWHTVSSSTSGCAFGVRANETDDIEARSA